jgi:hypothetical protein
MYDPQYPFRQVCNKCELPIADDEGAVRVDSGAFVKGEFTVEEYPVYYHTNCFDSFFPH